MRPVGDEVMVVCSLLKMVAERLGAVNAAELETVEFGIWLGVKPYRGVPEGIT